VDWPEVSFQLRQRLAFRRQIGHRAEYHRTMQPTELSAFEQHILPPTRDPHLAPFPALEQTTCLIPSSSHHVPPFTEWFALPSVASRYPSGSASSTSPRCVAGGLALRVDELAQVGAIEADVLAELNERQAVLRVVARVF